MTIKGVTISMATITVSNTTTANYSTIQEAINAAKAGDTITVSSGTYNEAITINKSLTLLGAGANINPIEGGRSTGESILTGTYPVTITASDVTLNGFEIQGFRYGVNIPSSGFDEPSYLLQNINISYNWIHSTGAWVGINAEPGTLRNYTISHNIIFVSSTTNTDDPYALAAISFSGGATSSPTYENVTVSNNSITNLSNEYGIFAGADPSSYLINGITISCNHFKNTSTGSNFNIGNILNGEFTNNVVEDTVGTIGISGGSITDNNFINGGHLNLWGTEYGFTRPSANLNITNNIFSDEVFGLGIKIRTGSLSYTININENAFLNSNIGPSTPPDYSKGYLIINDGIGTVNATLNWWDSELGVAGNSGEISGAVTVAPYISQNLIDPDSQVTSTCWPLSTLPDPQPGYYPLAATGISYIGKTQFKKCECIILIARVSYTSGNGSGFPVEFNVCHRSYRTHTLPTGIAYVCLDRLSPGLYNGHICSGSLKTNFTFSVGGCSTRPIQLPPQN